MILKIYKMYPDVPDINYGTRNSACFDIAAHFHYQNSPLIIDAINQANAQETEYQYIYSTVVDVMNHVNNQEWQQAHDLYMAMYNNLKNTYLGM